MTTSSRNIFFPAVSSLPAISSSPHIFFPAIFTYSFPAISLSSLVRCSWQAVKDTKVKLVWRALLQLIFYCFRQCNPTFVFCAPRSPAQPPPNPNPTEQQQNNKQAAKQSKVKSTAPARRRDDRSNTNLNTPKTTPKELQPPPYDFIGHQ
jgi:hypothetical protein